MQILGEMTFYQKPDKTKVSLQIFYNLALPRSVLGLQIFISFVLELEEEFESEF